MFWLHAALSGVKDRRSCCCCCRVFLVAVHSSAGQLAGQKNAGQSLKFISREKELKIIAEFSITRFTTLQCSLKVEGETFLLPQHLGRGKEGRGLKFLSFPYGTPALSRPPLSPPLFRCTFAVTTPRKRPPQKPQSLPKSLLSSSALSSLRTELCLLRCHRREEGRGKVEQGQRPLSPPIYLTMRIHRRQMHLPSMI